MRRRGSCVATGLGGLALCLLGCARTGETGPTAAASGPLLALVAASAGDAVREASDLFTRDSGIEVTLNADDSSRLAQQVVNGSPADVFLSASEPWARFVQERGFAREVRPLLGNTLVLVVPAGNPAHVAGPQDLTSAAVRRVAVAGPTVPAGVYARQALRGLRLWDPLEREGKVVSGENVRVTLTYVERAEVEAGIVYGTDARASSGVRTVHAFASSTHDRIVYPLVLLGPGAARGAAREYFNFLRQGQAAAVFRRHGFVPLPGG